jgi:hypothetical protein
MTFHIFPMTNIVVTFFLKMCQEKRAENNVAPLEFGRIESVAVT